MLDALRKLLGALTLVGALGMLVFSSRYYGGSSYSIAGTLGLGPNAQLVGFVGSAVLFVACGIAVGASLEGEQIE